MDLINTTKNAKLAARDILRAQKLCKWLSRKNDLEVLMDNDKKAVDERIAYLNLNSDIAFFEATNLPDAHPDKTNRVARAQKTKDYNDKIVTNVKTDYEARLLADNKRLDEIMKALDEWNDGTRKVDLDALNALTDDLIRKAVTAEFKTTPVDNKA
jgi:hypothetical protein